MKVAADKTPENKSQIPVKEPTQALTDGQGLTQFTDNRPETAQLQQLQEMANQSAQVGQIAQLQAMANGSKSQDVVQKQKNNTGLPDNLKSGIENLSGMSMDDVKVHRNSDKPAQLNAHAYAQGTDIHISSGQEKHLPHEAWHVVQQKQGRVKPTMRMKRKVDVNDDPSLEKEADVMGAKALQMKGSDRSLTNLNLNTNIPNTSRTTVVQGLFLPEAKRDIEEDQMTLKTEWYLANSDGRREDKALIARMQSETGVKPDAIMVAGSDSDAPSLELGSSEKKASSGQKKKLRQPAPPGSVYLDQLPKHGTNQLRSFRSKYPHTTVVIGKIIVKTGIVKIKEFHYSTSAKGTRYEWKSKGGGTFAIDTSTFTAAGLDGAARAYTDVSKRAASLGCVASPPP